MIYTTTNERQQRCHELFRRPQTGPQRECKDVPFIPQNRFEAFRGLLLGIPMSLMLWAAAVWFFFIR